MASYGLGYHTRPWVLGLLWHPVASYGILWPLMALGAAFACECFVSCGLLWPPIALGAALARGCLASYVYLWPHIASYVSECRTRPWALGLL